MDNQYWQLWEQLSTKEYHTSSWIAQQLGVSDKTIRVRLKELREILSQNGAALISKQRKGYLIEVTDRAAYDAFCQSRGKTSADHLPSTSGERVDFILSYLLTCKSYVRLEDIADMLFVSKNTLTGDIRQVESRLNEYHLQIHRRPNHGIRAEGSEFNKRLCITNYLVRQGVDFSNSGSEMKRDQSIISECILCVFRENGIQVEELSFQSLIYHLYTTLRRVQNGFMMLEQAGDPSISCAENKLARDVAYKILNQLHDKTGTLFPEPEAHYLAIHLAGKRALLGSGKEFENLVIPQHITGLAEKMLESAYESFQVDLRDNLELKLALAAHIVPLEIRIKYHLEIYNSILGEIKRNYAFPFTVATQAVMPLLSFYKTKLSDDEIGYFAILFALEMERGKRICKKNILLVCAPGKSNAEWELTRYRYQQEFGTYIQQIRLCRLQELSQIDFSDIDYVFTTMPIHVPVPVPIIEVSAFLEDSEISVLRRTLSQDKMDFITDYYSESLFFPDLDLTSKEAVISFLCKKVGKQFDLPEGFQDAVLCRENLAGTDLEKLVALPHPLGVVTKDTFACVAILKRPILWQTRQVQCVFLISVSDRTDDNIQKFYEHTSRLALDHARIEELIRQKTFPALLRLLKESQ